MYAIISKVGMPSRPPEAFARLAGILAALGLMGLPAASAAGLHWDSNGNNAGFGNTTGTWGTSAFWNDNPTGGAPTVAFATGTTSADTVNFGTATLNYANSTIGVAAGGVAVGSITIGSGQTTTINLGTSGNAITIHGDVTKNSGSAAFNVTSPVTLGGAQTWMNASANSLTASAALDNGGNLLTVDGSGNTLLTGMISGAGGITKNGSGKLSFNTNSTNIYTGTTTVNAGTLMMGNATTSLGGGNLILNGGMLDFYYSAGLSRTLGTGVNQVRVIGDVSGFGGESSQNPTVNLGATVVWGASGEGSATGHFNPGKFALGSTVTTNTTSKTTFSSGIDLNGASRTILVNNGTVGGVVATITGVISNSTGTAGLHKEGAGTLALNAANTFNGGITILDGTVHLGNATGLGSISAPLTISSGLLDLNGQTNVTVGNLTGTGGTIASNASNARTFIIGSGNGTGGDFQGVIADNTNEGTGSLSLVKTGAGTITLSGNNTYTGTTTISGGALQIGNGGTSGLLASSAVTNDTTLIYNRSNDFSVGYAISGTGELIKQGAGTMTFTNPAAYTGDTTISAGELKLNHPNVSNDGAFVTIADTGATLNLNFTGTDTVEELYIGATRMAYGIYKAIGSPESGIAIAQITGTGTLTVTGDVVSPTLLNMVDNKNGRPAPANSPISYTITFSEDIDENSVSAADFANAGTAPISIGSITQTTPGVFTVIVTPSDAGNLRLKIPAGAIITDPAGNPLDTTSDIPDNATLGIYVPDSTTPTLRGISPVANSSGSTLTLALPPGVRPGDLLIANIAYYDETGSTTPVSTSGTGWNSRLNVTLGGASSSRRAVVLSRTASSASPGPFVLNLNGTSPVATGVLMAFSGVDTSGLRYSSNVGFERIGTLYSGTSASATAGPAASVTTVLPDAAVLMLGMSIGTDSVEWSNWTTATSPGALTEIYDMTGSGTGINAMSLGAAWELKPSAGATGTGSASLSTSAINGSVLLALRPSYISSVMTALTELKAHVTGEITLSAAQISAHQATIIANRWTIGVSVSALAAALDLVSTYDEVLGPLWVARTVSSRGTDLHYTIFKVMQYIVYFGYSSNNLSNHSDLLNHFAFGSSANFPGACAPPADPEQVHTAVIDADYPDSWGRTVFGESSANPSPKPTGTYLAPGSIATVTVPAALVGRNFKIRIGAHDTLFDEKTAIKRLDQCSIEYTINSTTTQVANPLGGGIYILVPQYVSDVGIVSVQIKNAVRSPYFSAKGFHQTTLAEWQNTERHHPAPWADFQSDKVMMQVPTSWIYALNDPVTLMADWDRSADIVNDLMGFPRDRGRETIYNQVDLLISGNGGFTPGYPAVNNTYTPGANYNNGYANNYLIRGPQFAPYTEFHELGHAYQIPKLSAERESDVNLLYVPVLHEGFGYSLDEAFRRSLDGRDYVTLDTTAIAWMMCDTFLNGLAMPEAEKQYAFKGHAKFVETARLFGWERLGKYFHSMNEDYEANESVATDVDSLLLRLSSNVNTDIRPLFHFWGFPPVNGTTLDNSIQAANLPASRVIYDALVRYKSLVPPDNTTFRTFANGWWGRQPLSTGFSEERYHATRWDSYDTTMAAATAGRAQQIIDLYFPAGRPSDYGDWRSQWVAADLLNPQADLDGDGMSNEHERIWGLDPTSNLSRNPLLSISGLKSGSFSYTRRNRALTGLNYSVWTSTNLKDWTEDTGAEQTPGVSGSNGAETVETVLSPELLQNPNLFLRMRASE